MNYAEMSDFEINRKVLAIASGAKPLGYAHNADKRSAGVVKSNQYHWYDYCNSWADAGPIIEREKINIEYRNDCNGFWLAGLGSGKGSHAFLQKKPLRAAMIVFLMMQEQPNA